MSGQGGFRAYGVIGFRIYQRVPLWSHAAIRCPRTVETILNLPLRHLLRPAKRQTSVTRDPPFPLNPLHQDVPVRLLPIGVPANNSNKSRLFIWP